MKKKRSIYKWNGLLYDANPTDLFFTEKIKIQLNFCHDYNYFCSRRNCCHLVLDFMDVVNVMDVVYIVDLMDLVHFMYLVNLM